MLIPSITLDRTSAISLSRQIYRQMSVAIRHSGPDFRLPSTRVLATLLGVSRNTVLAAYDELRTDGLICGTRGSGTHANRGASKRIPIQFRMEQVIRESAFPVRALQLDDPDGNALYIRY